MLTALPCVEVVFILCLFLAVPWICFCSVIVPIPDHTQLLFAGGQRKATEYDQVMASGPFCKDSHWVECLKIHYMNISAFTVCQITLSTSLAITTPH